MKIIEAMKQIKELQQKAEDYRQKVGVYCADLDFETPVYADQREQVRQWLQGHADIMQEILRLRIRIQKTNLATKVIMQLDNKPVEKTIAEWIHRRRDLAGMDQQIWDQLSDRGLKEGNLPSSQGGEARMVKIRRYYDPAERDKKVGMYMLEPSVIDRTLEVVNATTDLQE